MKSRVKSLSSRQIWRLSIGMGIVLLALLPLFLFYPTEEVDAQCGSSASSCKACHEVQGEDPVNAIGEWHTAHAFGDFCEFCHAGNVDSKVQDEAHIGLVDPFSDIKAGCQSCHPQDYTDKAQVYALILGVQVGTGGGSGAAPSSSGGGEASPPSTESSTSTGSDSAAAPAAASTTKTSVSTPGSGKVIDFAALYIESITPEQWLNTGDWVLIGLIGLLLLGFAVAIWKLEHYGDRLLQWWQENMLPSSGQPVLQSAAMDAGVAPMPSFGHVGSLPARPARKAAAPVTQADIQLPELEDLFRRKPELRAVWPHLVRADAKTVQALAALLPQAESDEVIQRLANLDLTLVTELQKLSSKDQALVLALAQIQ